MMFEVINVWYRLFLVRRFRKCSMERGRLLSSPDCSGYPTAGLGSGRARLQRWPAPESLGTRSNSGKQEKAPETKAKNGKP